MKSARNRTHNTSVQKVMSTLSKMGLRHHRVEAARHTIELLRAENKALLDASWAAVEDPDRDLYWTLCKKRWSNVDKILALQAKYNL